MTASRPRTRNELVAELQRALGEMFGAERRMRARDKVSAEGLTVAQIRALLHLSDHDQTTVGALAKMVDVNPATMTAMLDQLEALGVVVRERATYDRRVVMVSLTASGEELVERKRRSWEQRWLEAFADVSDAQLLTIARALRRIAGTLDQIGRDREGKLPDGRS